MNHGRWPSTAMLIAALGLGLSGCAAHRKVQPFVMPPFTPVALLDIPEPDDPPMVEEDEDAADDLPPVPVAEGAATPKRQRRRPVKPPVQAPPPDETPVAPPPQVAASAEPAPSSTVIGELTPGGDQSAETEKEAADLIASNEKRLNAISAETVKAQSALVSNVRNFQKQAQQALRTGDARGAKTLATKGKLLLDDLEKAGGS